MTLPIYMTPSEHLAEEALETYALGRFATEEGKIVSCNLLNSVEVTVRLLSAGNYLWP